MSRLIRYDTNSYTSFLEILAALKMVPNFWDSTTSMSVTKGGVTILLDGNNRAIAGFGNSITLPSTIYVSRAPIAATEKGLVFSWEASSKLHTVALGCNEEGEWGGMYGYEGTDGIGVRYFLADSITSTTFAGPLTNESNPNTQIVDLACNKGNFLCQDLRRVLYAPSAVISYNGKLTMPNGEKYVKNGAFALRYTE